MRLLFAKDEKSLSRAITAILKKNHYEVDAVYDGEEALAYLECGTYDGAILDIMMPKKDGLTVLKEIRRQGINTPVLMLTAKAFRCTGITGAHQSHDPYTDDAEYILPVFRQSVT